MDNLIMLPTGKPARKGQIVLCQDGLLRRASSDHKEFHVEQPPQHLYQICNEEIKAGDWFVYRDHFVKQCIAVEGNLLCSIGLAKDHKAGAKLIVASTNPLLTSPPNNLPGIDPEVITQVIASHNPQVRP